MTEVKNGRTGSSFDDFLDEEGIRGEVEAHALKEVLAWQIGQEIRPSASPRRRWRAAFPTAAKLDHALNPKYP